MSGQQGRHNGKTLTPKYEKAKEQQHAWYMRNKEKKKKYSQEYYAANRDKKLQWQRDYRENRPDVELKTRLKCMYGITPDTFYEMLFIQNNKCAICAVFLDSKSKKTVPHVDHCHATGKVRGILCHQCNMMLGRAERPGVFDAMKLYLDKA